MIVWDDLIETLQKLSEGKFFQGRKGPWLQEGADGAQRVLVEHKAPEQGKLQPNQPRQADEHGPVCTSQGKHIQGYLQRLLYQCHVPENKLEMSNLILSSYPSHCSLDNTQCLLPTQHPANLSYHFQALGRTNLINKTKE